MQEPLERVNQVNNNLSDAPADDSSTRIPKLHAIALAWLEADAGESEIRTNDATGAALGVGISPSVQMDALSDNMTHSLENEKRMEPFLLTAYDEKQCLLCCR